MRTKALVAVLALGVLFYLVTLGQRGWALLSSGTAAGVLLGAGVLLLPLFVTWAMWREVRFGMATEQMARQLDGEGALPAETLARTPSGRVDRAAADDLFTRYRAAVESAPGDWRGWFRLAWAYDIAGDRRRARAAMRHAVNLFG